MPVPFRPTPAVRRQDIAVCSGLLPTVAISILMPFGRFLNVGGKRENMAKLIFCPDSAAPSTVTVKLFDVELGVVVGISVTFTWAHAVWAPDIAAEVDTRA